MKGVRGGKLKLKGQKKDAIPKVRKTMLIPSANEPSDINENVNKGWMEFLKESKSLKGPFVLIGSESHITAISENGECRLTTFEDQNMESFEPSYVEQVLVSESLEKNTIFIKSWKGNFLSCDQFGKVFATQPAAGARERWVLSPVESGEGFSLKSHTGKYLSVDLEKEQLRADSKEIGSMETFRIFWQTRPKLVKDSEFLGDLGDDTEERISKKFVSWEGGKARTGTSVTKRDLERASAEGRLHETLLDSRIKHKHDPFC